MNATPNGMVKGIAALSLLVLSLAACAPAQTGSSGTSGGPSVATQPAIATSAPTGQQARKSNITGPNASEAKKLTGTGATFPAPLYTKYFSDYNKVTGVEVSYTGVGSSGGINGISDQTVDFGATDSPMTDDQLSKAKGGPILHIPMALGAVVATYNIPEIGTTNLKFTGDTLSKIFLGTITKWNDPALAADNPGIALPNQDIVVVRRSDGSGTTFTFTDYLSSVSADFNSKVGKGNSVNWPVGIGASGNAGIAGEVKNNPYAIGYVDLIYAKQNKLGYGFVKNKFGAFIEPTLSAVSAAAADAKSFAPDLRVSIVNQADPKAYPISTMTWMLVYQNQTDKAEAIALTRMLWWASHDGQALNESLEFAQVPEALQPRIEEMIKSIKVDGAQALPTN